MTPTRELALQTTTECRRFCKALDRHVVCVYGGTDIALQIAELKRGADIVVCTPGRMIDMLTSNNGQFQFPPSFSSMKSDGFVYLLTCRKLTSTPNKLQNPGRVTNVRRTTIVVLDEADRMFDMGFEPQVMRILDCVRPGGSLSPYLFLWLHVPIRSLLSVLALLLLLRSRFFSAESEHKFVVVSVRLVDAAVPEVANVSD